MSLFSGEPPLPEEPAVFRQIRPYLRAVISNGPQGRAITDIRAELDHLLEGTVKDDRDHVINRMLRRAILEQIRIFLHRLMASTPQLVAAGVESTQAIADALGPYGRWRATPTGPLGRLVFAFTEHRDDTGDEPARLTTAAFGGDPHVHTVSLGDTTALALAGTRRIVLGLSATAYFPGAPHHHVHTRPRWWVSDDNPGTVTIEAAPVTGQDQADIKVSGIRRACPRRGHPPARPAPVAAQARRRAAAPAPRRPSPGHESSLPRPPTTGRGRSPRASPSPGVAARRICLAVRPRPDEAPRPGGHIVTDAGRWLELPADRLEDFSAVEGADILIAPLARVQRGVNIIGEGDRSALGSVWLIVRPIPVIDEPAELVAHLQARALGDNPGSAEDPLPLLRARRDTAGQYFEEIVRRPPYFQAQPREVKLSVTAEIINNAIQLIGRARRGGTPAVLHLVDGAFLDPLGGTDFATLIAQLRSAWADCGSPGADAPAVRHDPGGFLRLRRPQRPSAAARPRRARSNAMLITLAYRLPRACAGDVLGTVTAYPLTQEFSDAWATLPTGRGGRQPRYRSLATGLCAATAQPVRLFGERDLAQQELDAGNRMLLLTSHPFDYRLATAVAAWEHHTRADQRPQRPRPAAAPARARPPARRLRQPSAPAPLPTRPTGSSASLPGRS